MTKRTSISVVMPCFNAAPFVRMAVESVLSQTWANLELIVIDDGSTDGSVEMLSDITDSRLRVFMQANCGAAAARNHGFSYSVGQHIIFIDADDLIGPCHLEALRARLDNCDRCIAHSRWDRFQVEPTEACFPSRSTDADLSGIDWLVCSWSDAQPMMQCGMMLIPRILIEEHGGWDERLSLIDDFEFFARILSRCDGVRFAPEARLYYRSGIPDSLSGQKNLKAIESQFLSLMLGADHLLGVENTPRTRLACANILQSFDYDHYPKHANLRARIRGRVAELGGADIEPCGPPGFHKLRPWIGWKAARHVQRAAERLGLNSAARRLYIDKTGA